ncbi:MAG: type II toxin-antitoxin system HipA family toxin [Planctomycetaceae bacterium]
MIDAQVILWGKEIAAVTWDQRTETSVFQFAPEFVPSGIQVAPLTMPLRDGTFRFPALNRATFKGLPGLLADSLPDKFGNALIDAWLVRQGRSADDFNPVERLCYVGSRGIGALEYKPTISGAPTQSAQLEVDALVQLAQRVLNSRKSLSGQLEGTEDDAEAIQNILQVGTSAGGARAKGILAWNESTGEFRSGQVLADDAFTYWIMKFDGISNNRDKELADPQGYGLIEYAYHLMAVEAGVEMSRCRIHEEGGRSHFMTQRFDRTPEGKKLHMQSLCAMRHFDFNEAGAYSYEQAIETCRDLGLRQTELEQQFRRAVFNVIARNQDDHVKNIAFLMDKSGDWNLSPAFDVAWSYNPAGAWTNRHQMTLNGKRDDFELDDLIALGNFADIKTRRAKSIVQSVAEAISNWLTFAETAGVDEGRATAIAKTHRLEIMSD